MVGDALSGEFRRVGDPGAVRARSLRKAPCRGQRVKFTRAALVEGRSR
jgi:hypothetical protein